MAHPRLDAALSAPEHVVQSMSCVAENYVAQRASSYDSNPMRSFEIIFMAPEPSATAPFESNDVFPAHSRRVRAAREVLDVFIGGANVTSRIADKHGACVLRDLGFALVDLGRSSRGKAIVRFYDDPWELCIERFGDVASLSVYRAGTDPTVAVYDRIRSVRRGRRERRRGDRLVLGQAQRREPARASSSAWPDRRSPSSTRHRRRPRSSLPSRLSRSRSTATRPSRSLPTSRFGEASCPPSSRASSAPTCTPYSFAVGCAPRSAAASSTSAKGTHSCWPSASSRVARPCARRLGARAAPHVRSDAEALLVGVRLGADGSAALTLGAPHAGSDHATLHIPGARRRRPRRGGARLRPRPRARPPPPGPVAGGQPPPVRVSPPAPRDGRRAPGSLPKGRQGSTPRPSSTGLSPTAFARRLRRAPSPRRASATRHAGARSSPGSTCARRSCAAIASSSAARPRPSASTAARAKCSGASRRSARRASSPPAASPACSRTASSASTTSARAKSPSAPGSRRAWADRRRAPSSTCPGSRASSSSPRGSATSSPSTSRAVSRGGVRLGRRGALRLKRAGKLLYLTSGDSALTALDVSTGAIVWRVRDRLRFRMAPSLDHDGLFAIAGGQRLRYEPPRRRSLLGPGPMDAPGRLWKQQHGRGGRPRDRQGRRVRGPRAGWAQASRVRSRDGRGLLDLAVIRRPERHLVARGRRPLHRQHPDRGARRRGSRDGRHSLPSRPRTIVEIDVPRRLEPVLRSGALFVPHAEVHVFRPSDGAELAVIGPCEAIPDLLRVDERCDVYVAEESGHVASFAVGARLSVVR